MKTRKKKIGDTGIRLKPVENNLLENYTEFSKRRKKTRRKRKIVKNPKKPKKNTKSIEIHKNRDPFFDIIGENKEKTALNEIQIKEIDDKTDDIKDKPDIKEKPEKPEKPDIKDEYVSEIKKIKVEKKPQDLSETDPNVKQLTITASIEPDKKKKGSRIKLE